MLEIIEKCFPQYTDSIPELIPSYGKKLADNKALTKEVREWSHTIL
jgi:hypothetical protein